MYTSYVKVGLSACLQQMHWFSEAGFSETFFPRCYRLCMDDEKSAFQEDYRLTACMSYCRYFVENYEAKGASALVDPQSRITPLSIDFASRQLGNYIRMRRHEDIDWLLPPNFSKCIHTIQFFIHFYSLSLKIYNV
jgi:tubulin monoglycylase TTLL3/8